MTKEAKTSLWKTLKKLVRFMFWGLPGFLVAIPLNYWLVVRMGWPKPPAYALVLVVQVTINFFFCRALVFDTTAGLSLWKSFLAFFSGIILFRAADWGLYVLLTSVLGCHFLATQLLNAGLFIFLKFQYSKRIFEGPSPPAGEQKPH